MFIGGAGTDADRLWKRLRDREILVDARVVNALRDVPIAPFVDPALARVTPLDAPIPSLTDPSRIIPSPRFLAMWLQMLELEKGVSVLLLGSSGGYVEALLTRLIEPATVTVLEEEPDVVGKSRAALATVGLEDRVAFVTTPTASVRFDRVTTTDAIQRLTATARDAIADMGFAVFRRYHEAFGFVKVLRSGEEFVELSTAELAGRPRAEGDSRERTARADIGRELLLTRMLENVWRGRPESDHERHFREVVDDTYAKPGEMPPMTEDEATSYAAAKKLFEIGYVYQSAADLDAAIDAYSASIVVHPTAEAHTFLGWVYSFQDRYEEAIAECERAIAVDPSFGNPYNDIGAYLIELERLDEAIPWFEKAKVAKRYCCYFYAYSNLGRVYMMKGMVEKAKREFEEALRINPNYEYARELLRRVGRGPDYVA